MKYTTVGAATVATIATVAQDGNPSSNTVRGLVTQVWSRKRIVGVRVFVGQLNGLLMHAGTSALELVPEHRR